jgi:DnaK suppressor protein
VDHNEAVDGADSELDQMRSQIRIERERLIALVASLAANLDEMTDAADANPPDDEHDPEGHTIAFERSQLTSRRNGYLGTIAALEVAESRLDETLAESCESCGEPIPLERRLAVPTTNRCVTCASSGPLRGLGARRG